MLIIIMKYKYSAQISIVGFLALFNYLDEIWENCGDV